MSKARCAAARKHRRCDFANGTAELLHFYSKKTIQFLTLVCLIDILSIDVLEVIILYSIHFIDQMTKGYFIYDELFIVLS